jgi:small subunit ribosomal protein S4
VARVNESLGAVARAGVPSWIELDADAYKSEIKSRPERTDVSSAIEEQLIVELYSK